MHRVDRRTAAGATAVAREISDPTGEDLRDDVRNRAIGSEDSRNAGEVILEVCAEY